MANDPFQEKSLISKFNLFKMTLPYHDRRVWIMGILGFFCGLPLLLTGSTLSFWLAKEGIDLKTVGFFSLVALPYTFKFFWSPLIDRLKIPFLTRYFGRRRSWMLVSQVFLFFSLLWMGTLSPHDDPLMIALSAFLISFSAATFTIALFGYQFERLGPTQYGAGEATLVFGYRLGMLLAGAGSLYMATWMSWNQVYQTMAFISAVGVLFTFRIAEPEFKPNKEALRREENIREYLKAHPKLSVRQAYVLSWCYGALVCPLSDFARKHKGWALILLLMFLYRLGDNLIGNMSNIFYAEWGFTNQEIAQASKMFGMGATILGGFAGGLVVTRWGMMKGLFYCCLFHAFATLAYLWVYEQGHDMTALYTSIALENITGGMRMTALFAYQLTLCSSFYAATQLSLMSSLIELGRTTCSSLSGWLVTSVGWKSFFIIASTASLPALLIVFLLARLSGESLLGKNRPSSFLMKHS